MTCCLGQPFLGTPAHDGKIRNRQEVGKRARPTYEPAFDHPLPLPRARHSVQAGGGWVNESQPEAGFSETVNKTKAMPKAMTLAEPFVEIPRQPTRIGLSRRFEQPIEPGCICCRNCNGVGRAARRICPV